MEEVFLRGGFVEYLRPIALEINGVDQQQPSQLVQRLGGNKVRNLASRLLLNPLVDFLTGDFRLFAEI